MQYAQWHTELNEKLYTHYRFVVSSDNSLTLRLFDAGFTVEESLEPVHQWFVIEVNRIATLLYEQVRMELTFTIWDENRASNQHRGEYIPPQGRTITIGDYHNEQ